MIKLWLVLSALDVLTTHLGLRLGAVEANPIMGGLITGLGEFATYGLKLFFALVVAALVHGISRPHLFKWLNLTMGLVIFSNIAVLAYIFPG